MIRIKTGIHGLDELIEGGFIEGSTILVSGGTGTGKTTFGLQFVYNGAAIFGEPGVIITIESRPDEIRTTALHFGWDLRRLEQENRIIIIDVASSRAGLPTSERHALRRGFDLTTLAEEIYLAVEEIKAKRVVIDSLSVLPTRYNDPAELREYVYRIGALLQQLRVTSVLIGECERPDPQILGGAEQFVTQGLIRLNLEETNGHLQRSLVVWKMRNTNHSMRRHPFLITEHGIEVNNTRTLSGGISEQCQHLSYQIGEKQEGNQWGRTHSNSR